nr:LLM class flavin-dependent oxidoreductase [Acrocarpospora catenulata]
MSPRRTAKQVFSWAVDQAIHADQSGLTEFWIGEHATQAWESVPNPELVIAAAALQTEQITLAPGAHLLPYHQPGSLAIQIGWLTQILEGRYILGVGAGAFPGDALLRGIRDMKNNHRMVAESIEIMEKIWAGEPFWFEGEFWNAGYPEEDPAHPWRNMLPWGGKVPIGVTGLSMNSPSMRFAGQRGYLPVSVYSGVDALNNHWETYSTAAVAAGRTPRRADHRVVRDVLIADTDDEARRLAKEGGMGHAWQEYLLPIYQHHNLLDTMLTPGMTSGDVDLDWLCDNVWVVGSAETVLEKLRAWREVNGEFGTLMIYNHDYSDDPAPWKESMRRLAHEVGPKLG